MRSRGSRRRLRHHNTGDGPELFSYLAELYYRLVFPIMLCFILLILYIMNTMFIKYFNIHLMRT